MEELIKLKLNEKNCTWETYLARNKNVDELENACTRINDIITEIYNLDKKISTLETNLSNIELTPGPVGPRGPVGMGGSIGPRGPVGKDGFIGPQGPVGKDGSIGPRGPRGPVGNDGPIGPQGPSGPMGPSGGDVCKIHLTYPGNRYYTRYLKNRETLTMGELEEGTHIKIDSLTDNSTCCMKIDDVNASNEFDNMSFCSVSTVQLGYDEIPKTSNTRTINFTSSNEDDNVCFFKTISNNIVKYHTVVYPEKDILQLSPNENIYTSSASNDRTMCCIKDDHGSHDCRSGVYLKNNVHNKAFIQPGTVLVSATHN